MATIFPRSPRNLVTQHVLAPTICYDLVWDNPATDPENSHFEILGVNVFRSFDDGTGQTAFEQINANPVGVNFYRDQPELAQIAEPILPNRVRKLEASGDYCIKLGNQPIVKDALPIRLAKDPMDVTLIDTANVDYPIKKIYPRTGEILISAEKLLNIESQIFESAPNIESAVGLIATYTVISNDTGIREGDVSRRVFYKVTTVARNAQGNVVETPLTKSESIYNENNEPIDWIWTEAIRRNKWILYQGGERVLVYLRSWYGERCSECLKEVTSETSFHARHDCAKCFGVGYDVPYFGPYEIIIAPPDTDKMIEITDVGMRLNYDFRTWTGPTPFLSTRDLIVRKNGDRFEIGSITPYSHRGAILQQEFSIQLIDRTKIQYEIGRLKFVDLPVPLLTAESAPYRTEKDTIPDGEERRGRTLTWSNITY